MSFTRVLVFTLLLTATLTPLRADEEPVRKTFFLPKSPTAAAYVLGRLSNKELSEAPRSEFVYVALLQRKGLDKKFRLEALCCCQDVKTVTVAVDDQLSHSPPTRAASPSARCDNS